jgi:hypothetical protein
MNLSSKRFSLVCIVPLLQVVLFSTSVQADQIISVDLQEKVFVNGERQDIVVATIALLRNIEKMDNGNYHFTYQFHAAYGGHVGDAVAVPILPGVYAVRFPTGPYFLVDEGGQLASWFGPNNYGGLTGFSCLDP